MKVKDLLADALPVISQFAPTIGAAIGGPFGIAAGYALPVLAHAFDIKPSNLADLVSKITGDENSHLKLQEIEQSHSDVIGKLMYNFDNLSSAKINIELAWQSKTND